jgi:hypothetical protein
MTLVFEKYVVFCVSKVTKFAFLRVAHLLLAAEFVCQQSVCKV